MLSFETAYTMGAGIQKVEESMFTYYSSLLRPVSQISAFQV